MRRANLLIAAVPLLGVFANMILAYWHSSQVIDLFEQHMHRDIGDLSDALAKADMPEAQARAVVAALHQVDHNVFSYVSSETTALVSAIATVGLLTTIAIIALVARTSGGPDR